MTEQNKMTIFKFYIKNILNKLKYYIVFSLLFSTGAVLLNSCSQKNNSFVPRQFHNTTAHYNAYFLCKERLLTVEQKLRDHHIDDYNQVLHLYPSIDSNFTKSFDADFKYINERAILIPEKHRNSRWVDDAYILLGKVKMYRVKLDSSEKFFRYINNHFKDEQGIQSAQLHLIQNYLLQDNPRYARMAEELVLKNKPFKGNNLLYHKTLADYYRYIEDYRKMLPQVLEAVKYEPRKDERARMYYILGQLYRIDGNEPDSYLYFIKAQKRNPPYILQFNARLSELSVASVTTKKEKKRSRKHLDRLIKNPNNTEYLDRVYYEIASYFQKHEKIDSTISNVEKSLLASKGNQLQKGYSYLLNAETYYEEVDYLSESRKKPRSTYYIQSKLYYDSTISLVDSSFKNYIPITERQEILERFVEQVLIVEKEDSLLRWAMMDSTDLAALIERLAVKEEKRLIAKEEARRNGIKEERAIAEAKQQASSGGIFNPNAISTFSFSNPSSIENAKLAFKAKWGDRPLEDNWRRLNKESDLEEENTEVTIEEKETEEKEEEDLDAPIIVHVDRDAYYKDIPYTDEQKKVARIKIEKSLYLLGRIYNNELLEKEYAIQTFEKHIDEYPLSEHRAEALYTLAILCQNSTSCESQKYANLLQSEFPNSKYAKLINNPNYVADYQKKNQEAREVYDEAYTYYQSGRYIECNNTLGKLKSLYPINDIPDKIQFLTVLTYAKRDRMFAYHQGLKNFLVKYKTSEIIPYAKRLITVYEKENGGQLTAIPTSFTYDSTATYFILSIYQRDSLFFKSSIDNFNKEFFTTYYKQKSIGTKRMELNSDNFVFTFKSFDKEKDALECLKKISDFADFKGLKSNYKYYIISKKNYQYLISTEKTDGYGQFFRQHYP